MWADWEFPATIPVLEPTIVQLWRLDLRCGDEPERVANLAAVLSPDELARAARIRVPGVEREFRAARGLLRCLLGAAVDRDPAEVRFEVGAFGKPRLQEGSGVEFNVSHSRGLVLIVLARRGPIGVDVEVPLAEPAFDAVELVEIAREGFPEPVAQEIARTPAGPARVDAFYRAWTIREAVAKADGRGIGSPLAYRVLRGDESGEFRVSLDSATADGRPVEYFVRHEQAGGDSFSALATVQPRARIARYDASTLVMRLW